MTPNTRKAMRQKIKIAQKQMGIDDDSYRAILRDYGGAKGLGGKPPSSTEPGVDLENILARLRGLGFCDSRPARAGQKPVVAASKQALVDKIDAYLAEARLPFKYAAGIARRMYGIDLPQGGNLSAPVLMEWLDPRQLRGIVAALEKSARRHHRATA